MTCALLSRASSLGGITEVPVSRRFYARKLWADSPRGAGPKSAVRILGDLVGKSGPLRLPASHGPPGSR